MIEINQNKWGSTLEYNIIEQMDERYRVQSEYDPEKVAGFFNKKGAVEMLLMLADSPKPFETLNKVMTVSRSTVSNRLTQASKIGLIGEDTVHLLNDKKVRPYRLSIIGLICVEIANECGVSDAFEQWYDKRKNYRSKLVEFSEEIEDQFIEDEETDPIPELEDLFEEHIKDAAGRTVDVDF